MTLPQADRDRLAEWMGWERREHDYDVALRPGATDTARGHLWYDGDEFVMWGENFLNPPDWREAGMLLERLKETPYRAKLLQGQGMDACTIYDMTTGKAVVGKANKKAPEAVALAVLAMLEAQE